MWKFIVPVLVLAATVMVWAVIRNSGQLFKVGGMYSIENGDGTFGVIKLLVHENQICHVRIYKQKFPSRPSALDLSTLSLGGMNDPDGFGLGHMPMREAMFLNWKPILISTQNVTPEELEGYHVWKDAGGGVF